MLPSAFNRLLPGDAEACDTCIQDSIEDSRGALGSQHTAGELTTAAHVIRQVCIGNLVHPFTCALCTEYVLVLQVVKKAIEFYVGSCAENSVEERQQAAVIDSAWSALDQMLSRVFSVPGLSRIKQTDLHTRPRPAALKSAGECHVGVLLPDLQELSIKFATKFLTCQVLQRTTSELYRNPVPQDCRDRRGQGHILPGKRAKDNE